MAVADDWPMLSDDLPEIEGLKLASFDENPDYPDPKWGVMTWRLVLGHASHPGDYSGLNSITSV